MSIFDIFRKKKSIPKPWKKYYTDEEFDINIPNINLYEQIKRCTEKYDEEYAIEYFGRKFKYKSYIEYCNFKRRKRQS